MYVYYFKPINIVDVYILQISIYMHIRGLYGPRPVLDKWEMIFSAGRAGKWEIRFSNGPAKDKKDFPAGQIGSTKEKWVFQRPGLATKIEDE